MDVGAEGSSADGYLNEYEDYLVTSIKGVCALRVLLVKCKYLMAMWYKGPQSHEMFCHDPEIQRSWVGWIELGIHRPM